MIKTIFKYFIIPNIIILIKKIKKKQKIILLIINSKNFSKQHNS